MRDAALHSVKTLEPLILDNEHEFSAFITIRHLQKEDYFLKIQFPELSFDDFKKVLLYSRSNKKIIISSPKISRESIRINHIRITNAMAKSDFSMVWECLSSNSPSSFYDLREQHFFK